MSYGNDVGKSIDNYSIIITYCSEFVRECQNSHKICMVTAFVLCLWFLKNKQLASSYRQERPSMRINTSKSLTLHSHLLESYVMNITLIRQCQHKKNTASLRCRPACVPLFKERRLKRCPLLW